MKIKIDGKWWMYIKEESNEYYKVLVHRGMKRLLMIGEVGFSELV